MLRRSLQGIANVVLTLLLLLIVLLSGCSDDDAGKSTALPQNPAPPPDVAAPSATITFPGSASVLTFRRVTVRGTARDQSTITSVTVNGVAATSTDDFATWEVAMDLPLGTSTLMVSTEDMFGNRAAAAATATINIVEPLRGIQALALEATGQLVITTRDAVVRIDPKNGNHTIVSDATTGRGPMFGSLEGIAVEATGQLVVLDRGLQAIVRVDPRSGDRRIVADATTGRGPSVPLFFTGSIAVEATGQLIATGLTNRDPNAFVSFSLGAVVRVDPVSGHRNIISQSPGIGNGPGLGAVAGGGLATLNPAGLAVEATGQLVWLDESIGALIRIDPVSGDRAIVSNAATGRGPLFASFGGLAVEATGQLVVAAGERVIRVDPRSGDRTVITDATTGSGPQFFGLGGIVVEPTGQLVVVQVERLARDPHMVGRIDPVSGNRTVLSGIAIGRGPRLISPQRLAVEATGRLVVLDQGRQGVVRVDPASGDRTIVTDAMIGRGPLLALPQDIAVQADGQLLVIDDDFVNHRVIRVNPVSGDRTIVADVTTGSGPTFTRPRSIAVEATGQVVVLDNLLQIVMDNVLQAVIRIDPVTGDRTIVTDATRGRGPLGSLPEDIAVEATGQLVVLAGFIMRVDPRSGDRTIIADATMGRGPILSPSRLAIEATGQLVVLGAFQVSLESSASEGVVRVDPISGDRTIITDVIADPGLTASLLEDLTIDATGQLAVTDAGLGAILRIDARSGAHAIISR